MLDPIFGVRLPVELRSAIDDESSRLRVSRSFYVRELLRKRLQPVLIRQARRVQDKHSDQPQQARPANEAAVG